MKNTVNGSNFIYQLEDKPKVFDGILLGLQHILVAFSAMIGVPLVVASTLGVDIGTTQILVTGVMFSCGICTLIQSLGLGFVGGRLPIIQGATFKFVPAIVMAYNVGGFPAVFGATSLGGIIEFGFSFIVPKIKKLFSPFLVGTILTVIGISLIPIGVNNFVAVGKPIFGMSATYIVGLLTIAVMLLLNIFGKGIIKATAIFIGIVFGYAISPVFGLVNFSAVADAEWIGFPTIFAFGAPTWPGITALVAMLLAYLISMVETIGDTISIATIVETEPTGKRLRGSIAIDGLSGPISAIFNGFPMTSFTQNIGLVKVTGVRSRFIVAISGGILILLGICPKFSAVISIMPAPVLGAALLITFSMIATEGIRQLSGYLESPRNQLVLGLSLCATLLIWIAPAEAFDIIPKSLQIFVSDSMITGLLAAFFLENILPKDKRVVQKEEIAN